jgi:hypothetical protein
MASESMETVAGALERARLQAERDGNYLEAEACRKQLAELEQLDDRQKLEALAVEQLAQRIGMDEAHMLELSQLRAFWDHRLGEIDDKARLVEEEMMRRHAAELRDLQVRRGARGGPPVWLSLRRGARADARRM